MGDMGDDFRALKQHNKEKRAHNTKSSTELLKDSGIEFQSKNNGAHLIISDCVYTVDFWPSSGKWIVRNGKRGHGVKNLIKLFGNK